MGPLTNDITSNYHQMNIFSVAAHGSLVRSKSRLRSQVLDYIKEQGELGATSEEVEIGLSLSHQTASARMTELKALGKVYLAGKRSTKSGRSAGVWVVSEAHNA